MAVCHGIPGQQSLHNLGNSQICILYLSQQLGQVVVRFLVILKCHLDQAEHNCAASSTFCGISKQEVLPINGERLTVSFCLVVADLQSAVFQILYQVWPLLLQIMECLAQGRLGRCCPGILPCEHSVQNRFRLLQPIFISFFCCIACNLLFYKPPKSAPRTYRVENLLISLRPKSGIFHPNSISRIKKAIDTYTNVKYNNHEYLTNMHILNIDFIRNR